jgi:hypothetical protein
MAGHGRFLYSWEGAEFAALSRRCCSSLLVPPMERDLPIYPDQVDPPPPPPASPASCSQVDGKGSRWGGLVPPRGLVCTQTYTSL